ncbi:MAG: hypothetical protein ACKVU1_16885 [bacterium]
MVEDTKLAIDKAASGTREEEMPGNDEPLRDAILAWYERRVVRALRVFLHATPEPRDHEDGARAGPAIE